ncbi:hypothetical protein ACOME3_009875 [Neoechinorhynchus agilis]
MLFCEDCDHGYHTYCMKSKKERPTLEGDDWYCYCCRIENREYDCCFACGDRNGELIVCEYCSKHYHQQCLVFKSPRRLCRVCAGSASNNGIINLTTSSSDATFVNRGLSSRSGVTESPVPPKQTLRKCPTSEEQMELNDRLKRVARGLIKNESSLPFRDPVDPNTYPDYYKIIQHPTSLRQIKRNAVINGYASIGEFKSDVERMFANCVAYNEYNSSICNLSRQLALVFEKALKENFPEDQVDLTDPIVHCGHGENQYVDGGTSVRLSITRS